MWSVWCERVDVYVGTGLVLVQRPGMPLWTFEPPTTLPLADVLRQVDQALDRDRAKPWRLRVHLSAALCLPVAFVVPAGVKQYKEVLAIARASAAQAWDVSVEQAAEIVCSLDAGHQGMAAAMLQSTHRLIAQWAAEHKGWLVSLRPLWAAATAAKACTDQQVECVALLEPDALTVLNLSPTGTAATKSWVGRYGPADALSSLAELRDQVDEAQPLTGVAMAFSREPTQNVWVQGPSAWAKHWSVLS